MICHMKVVRGHASKRPSPQIYGAAGLVELDIKFSLAFVASSFTLERGEMAFKGDLCAP